MKIGWAQGRSVNDCYDNCFKPTSKQQAHEQLRIHP
jgi:hypothetical protein